MFRTFICLTVLLSGMFLYAGEVFILQTTDLHGIVQDTNGKGGVSSILYSVSQEARKLGKDKTLLIDCGDLLQGSLQAAEHQGEFMIRMLNAAKYDVWVPGNHDFEFGSAVLSARINAFQGATLAANLRFQNVKPYRIFKKNGHKIAIVGMTNPHLHQWLFHPEKEGFHVLPVETAYRQTIRSLLKEKPDVIILAIHSGFYPSKRLGDQGLTVFAGRHPETKIILGGHTHEKIICKELGETGVHYFQSGAHGGGYLRIKLNFDDSTRKLLDVSGEYVPVAPRKDLPPAYRVNQKTSFDPIAGNFPAKLSQEGLAKIFNEAIKAAYPQVKGVFHGTLTSYRPKYKKLNRAQLFLLCPFENKVMIANINQAELNAILKEQKEMEKYGMKQFFFPSEDIQTLWSKNPGARYPVAFNSYVAAGAGGRFPVLKSVIDNPATNVIVTKKRIFDLLETYIKETYK